MARDLKSRRVLLTGATGGIGAALARRLAELGCKLVLAGRSKDKLDALVGELKQAGVQAIAEPADITSEADRVRLLQACREKLGGLDILINNAGVASWAHFVDSDESVFRTVMEVNFFAPVELTRAAIPMLTDGVQPAVVNVSSMCGRKAMPAWSEYSASKHALCGLTEALRGELARFDIDVLLMVPGLTNSGFDKNFLQARGKADLRFDKGMKPDDVAAKIVHSIQRNKTETVIGSDARWMLLMNRFFPKLTDYLLARKVKKLYQSA